MKIGKYDCHSIDMGDFLLDGGAMFGIVPKTLWERKIPADDKNRIPLKGRALLLKGNSRNILIDTGCGDKLDEKSKKMYGIRNSTLSINQELEKYKLTENDITDVVLTHLHFDHAGGATKLINNEAVPKFPNAEYHVSRAQWETALSPSYRDKASFLPDDFIPLKDNGVLRFLETGDEPIEGISLYISNGHTKGQIHPLINGQNSSVFYCGDLIPTSAHIPVAWHMGYDNFPVTIIKEKKEILELAEKSNWILFFEHDPEVAACTVKKGQKGIEIDKIIKI